MEMTVLYNDFLVFPFSHINQPPREIPLPMKKAAIEECSSDDDDTDGSTDGRRPSNDHVFTRPQV